MKNQLRNDDVKYCPICKGDLEPQASKGRAANDSTRYRCHVCERVFEINDHTASVVRVGHGK